MASLGSFNFEKIKDFVVETSLLILQYPMRIWLKLPEVVRLVVVLVVLIIAIGIAYRILRKPDEWRQYVH